MLTVKEVAERLGAATSSVRVWRINGKFPNAVAETTPRGIIWYIPEFDLEGFEMGKAGRPPKEASASSRAKKKG